MVPAIIPTVASQPEPAVPARRVREVRLWLDQPLSPLSCVLGWCLATAAFAALVTIFGGVGRSDTYESVFSTWAIAHGQFTCAFPAGYRDISPVYPLVSGAVSAVGHIGSSVAFPSRAALGPHCDTAFLAINTWSLKANALARTAQIAYLGWIVLMAGLISCLRASGRGRCGWEPATVMFVALLPPVWSCIQAAFHPQDLFAMGFALAAIACARRSAWVAAGVFIALAVLSQQFAVLVAVPLLVLAPGTRRLAYAGGAIAGGAVLVLPFLIANPRGAVHAILFGTGTTGGIGGTVLWEMDLHGALLVLLSRVAPVGLALVVSWWTLRRIGPDAALAPVALVALVAVCLSLRLVFEQQLFGYYFMALSVSLVLLDVIRGRIRPSLVAWLATTSMVYLLGSTQLDSLRSPWLTLAQDLIPLSVILLAAVLLVHEVRRGGPPWRLALWTAMIAGALITWNETDVLGVPPTWFWQVILVPLGIALAAGPLLAEIRGHDGTPRHEGAPRAVSPALPGPEPMTPDRPHL